MSYKALRLIGISGALFAMSAVAMGAFAAHGLKSVIDSAALETIRTAVFYQFIHSLAMLIILALMMLKPFVQLQHLLKLSGYLMLTGCILFSGSLYCLALTKITWFGPITPLGGVAFILAWLILAVAISRIKPSPDNTIENRNG